MNTKAILAAWFTLAVSAFAWPSDYHPSWQTNDTWQVRVSYFLESPNWDAIAVSTNLDSDAYPYAGLITSTPTNVTYVYTVLSVAETYQYKAPLYDPFIARPGRPNTESNSALATVVDVQPTNEGDFPEWRLFFLTNSMTLVEIVEKGSSGASHVNPYGQDAWLTWFLGDRRIIHDFPKLPAVATNECRGIRELNKGGHHTMQAIIFSNDVATVTLSRSNANYRMTQKATFVWERGKKWWTTAKVELGTNVVLSASLVEQ